MGLHALMVMCGQPPRLLYPFATPDAAWGGGERRAHPAQLIRLQAAI
ncbi:hypothetical protein [Methylocystis bryophila]|nr:hypothetical protein [Methylocystis bryophila]